MSERILKWLGILYPSEKLVSVKSWRPVLEWSPWDGHFYGIGWPTYRAIRRGETQATITPIWGENFFKRFQ